MNPALAAAATLAFLIGIAHSVLGERYILMRLFRRGELPRLFGGEWFTKRTLRFAWHITTLAWWGFAGVLLVLGGAEDPIAARSLVARVVASTFGATAAVALIASRGRHLSWLVFAAIAALSWWGGGWK